MDTVAGTGPAEFGLPIEELDPEAGEVVEAARERAGRSLIGRDLTSSLVIGGLFSAASLGLLLYLPTDRSFSFLTAALLLASYVVALTVEFEVGTGLAVPTQLVLVPMLFLLPVHAVPLLVALGLVLRELPAVFRRRIPPDRLLLCFVNSWHAIGPVLVLGLAAEPAARWASWPVFVGALAAQFALDFVSAAAREWFGLRVSPKALIRFMRWSYLVDAALAPAGLAAAFASVTASYAFLLALPLVAILAAFAHERTGRIDHALELSRAYRGTALLLGDIVEADDAYTGHHSRDVVDLVVQVAERLGLSLRERRSAELVALLHDVGKVRIPGEIINKPGALTDEERAIMNTHTIIGERMLEQVGGQLGTVGRLVRSCHERWDGQGYPDGLVGEAIPQIARIVCCCDAFSAMTTDRPYRKAMSLGEAVDELRRCSGTHFDPAVVEALVRTVG